MLSMNGCCGLNIVFPLVERALRVLRRFFPSTKAGDQKVHENSVSIAAGDAWTLDASEAFVNAGSNLCGYDDPVYGQTI